MNEDPLRSLLDRTFPWPRRGDKPLRRAIDIQHGAEIPENAWDRAVVLGRGYMLAGRLLVDSALANPHLRWALTLPALYTYRHAIELGLKSTLMHYGQAFEVDVGGMHKTHSLKNLWVAYQKLLNAVSHPDEEEGNRGAQDVVMAFHEWDEKSDSFRYAFGRDGTPKVLPAELIDLAQLRDVMEGFENFLSGVDGALEAATQEGPC